jgi:hypothetical protein
LEQHGGWQYPHTHTAFGHSQRHPTRN